METPIVNRSTVRVLSALCHSVDTPRALSIEILARHGEWGQLLAMRTDPVHYLLPDPFRRDNACTEFLRKCKLEGVVPSKVRRAKAIKSFWDSEHLCAKTNLLFSRILHNGPLDLVDLRAIEFLERAKKWVADVLGPLPPLLEGRYGPGATFGDRGRLTTIPDKIENAVQSTPPVSELESFITHTAWWRAAVKANHRRVPWTFVRGNRFTTVDKDAQKDRGICIEPSGNIFLQLAVGDVLKRRLKRAGVDLLRAQPIHQSMAREASRTGSHATIDLSSASDTVAMLLVKYLLPNGWFELLSTLRSPFTRLDGKWVRLEKFSSMGNGYTFELETLIFASLAYACGSGSFGVDFSVFGDDIIVPTEASSDLLALLRYCGFVPNPDKTYVAGYFRESCGGDFFNGEPVRAHNVEAEPSTPEEWISLANGLFRLGRRDPSGSVRYSPYGTAWKRCLDNLPSDIRRLRGPDSLGDLVINDDDDWILRVRSCMRYIRVYRPVYTRLHSFHWRPEVVLAAALYGAFTTDQVREFLVPRGGVSGYKVGWVHLP